MTDDVKALIAEARSARGGRFYGPISDEPGVVDLIDRLAGALEAAHAEPDNDEREALAQDKADWCVDHEAEPGIAANAFRRGFAAGFRRSARVPVSRDELTETLFELRYPEGFWSGGTHEPREASDEEVAGSLLATHDIYPKADRKPGDSGQAWRDRHGDVWKLGADGLLHSRETAPFSREHVEKKWGPLVPLSADSGGAGA